ncbi:GNAT family N-acetyltransferase [Cellulophaga sp. 20_2_10]|uniref:GNAT family N-acetyltransferase n=1 Tax=Cellulophaga sp. 20_2_10 TaxID=2942476 RepID=UPI00201B262B|nr:GNAT family N-acetyltransferase [Cellulophaga sp. 20_2_10]MCL5247324.1 GNAT family N-acetyltransferase [Cellulophaga sp. 20_2_10]
MNIIKLDWDSDFFGYTIGRVDVKSPGAFDFPKFKKNAALYRLVYLFSDQKIESSKVQLVDTKLTFSKQLEHANLDENSKVSIFLKGKDDFKKIEKLALQSGKYSRFKIDLNFKKNEYELLYKKWIRNSIYEEKAIEVAIFKDSQEILGFFTLEKKSDSLCDISLVAVDQNARGKKIGTKLINFAISQGVKKGFKDIQVVTQLENLPAKNLYEKCGFKICKTEYIYHYWNL